MALLRITVYVDRIIIMRFVIASVVALPSGAELDPVTPQAIAAIFARSLDLKLPAGAEAPIPQGLFQNP